MKIENLPGENLTNEFGHQDALSKRLLFWRRSIAKHLFAIFFLTLLVGAIAWFVASSLTPIYRATSTVFIESTKSKVVSIEEVYGGISGNRDHIQTQAEIIKSRDMATKLVKRLGLVTHPAVDPRQKPPEFNIAARLGEYIPAAWLMAAPAPVSDEAVTASAIGEVIRGLDVQLVRNSSLIRVSFESSDRNLATTVANILPEIYIENDLESRLQMTQKAASWLTGRLKGLRENLDGSERALQQFRDREKIIDSKGVALGNASQLTQLTGIMISSREKASEVENAYSQIQAVLKGQSRATIETIPAIMRNAAVARARDSETEAERRLAEASKRYGAEHPRMIVADTDLRSARESTRKTIDSVVTSITREYEVAKATERSAATQLEKAQTEIQNIGRKEFQLASLERDVQTNRQLYDLFLNRFKETSAAGDLQSMIARVIDPAVTPGGPVRPKQFQIIGIALGIGFILSILLAFLLERLDNTVRTTNDVSEKLDAPLLGILQWVRGRHHKFEIQRAFLNDTDHQFTESVRTLRTGILMSALDTPHKVVMVTSSVPEEGKTSVATNIAFALAQVKRTCLIDADMRRPTIAKVLGLDSKAPGLSQLVAGTEPPVNCIYEFEDSKLHYIPSGTVPPNPLELLSSKRFGDVLKKLEESFDVIVIDTPPVQLVSDAVIIAGLANALVYVVRADSTPYQVAKGGLEMLKKGKAQLLGVVLNQLDLQKAERYYGYGKYVSYGGKYSRYQRYGYSSSGKK